MVKNLLKNGKIIYPNKLILKKKINIGIIGSGKIANEYSKVINSFGHKIKLIVSKTQNNNAKYIAKKYKAQIISNIKNIDKNLIIDAWIVCTSWDKLNYYLDFFLKKPAPVLIEKGIPLNSNKILSFIKKYKKNSFINIAYNRNYYDYIPYLVKVLNKHNLKFAELHIYDSYKKIIAKQGIKISRFIKYFITSHWISLFLKILNISNYKITDIKNKKINTIGKNKIEKIELKIKKNKKKYLFDIINIPNGVRNHSLKLYFENFMIELSPFEKMSIFKKIKKSKVKNINIYTPQISDIKVDSKFKPGFRFMYYDFILKNFYNKNFNLNTNLSDLYKIYKICERLN